MQIKSNNVIPRRVSRLHLKEHPIFDGERHKGSCAIPVKTRREFLVKPHHMSMYDEETSWYPMKGLILSWPP